MEALCLLSSFCAASDYSPSRGAPAAAETDEEDVELGDDGADHFNVVRIGLIPHTHLSSPPSPLSLFSSPLECEEHQSVRSHPEDLIKDPISVWIQNAGSSCDVMMGETRACLEGKKISAYANWT